jgi:hypothetical protein
MRRRALLTSDGRVSATSDLDTMRLRVLAEYARRSYAHSLLDYATLSIRLGISEGGTQKGRRRGRMPDVLEHVRDSREEIHDLLPPGALAVLGFSPSPPPSAFLPARGKLESPKLSACVGRGV